MFASSCHDRCSTVSSLEEDADVRHCISLLVAAYHSVNQPLSLRRLHLNCSSISSHHPAASIAPSYPPSPSLLLNAYRRRLPGNLPGNGIHLQQRHRAASLAQFSYRSSRTLAYLYYYAADPSTHWYSSADSVECPSATRRI